MANRMKSAIDRLYAWQLETSGENVTYNGSPIRVVIAHVDHDMNDRYGTEMVALVQDFIIPTTAVANDPTPGDRIVREDGTTFAVTNTYEDYDKNCWRWSDPYRICRRVHAKQVSA